MNWNTFQTSLSNIVFGILLFSMISYWISLFFFKERTNLSEIGKYSTIIANSLLILILCSRWIVAGYFPLSNLYESLLFLTWTLLTIYLYVEFKTKSKLIGAILIPVTLLINGFANLTLTPEMQKSSPLVPALQSNWLMMHVSMMMLSYATLIMGSLLCILFLVVSKYKDVDLEMKDYSSLSLYNNTMLDCYEAKFLSSSSFDELSKRIDETSNQERGDKWVEKQFDKMYDEEFYVINKDEVSNCQEELFKILDNDPPKGEIGDGSDELSELGKVKLLQSLDNWSYRIIGLGFPFLTIGIIAGGVWANEAWGSYWSWDPKETWSLITWLVFATYLHSRITKGWEGKKTAILGSLGFFVIWICYLGVNFLGKGLHSYGWLS